MFPFDDDVVTMLERQIQEMADCGSEGPAKDVEVTEKVIGRLNKPSTRRKIMECMKARQKVQTEEVAVRAALAALAAAKKDFEYRGHTMWQDIATEYPQVEELADNCHWFAIDPRGRYLKEVRRVGPVEEEEEEEEDPKKGLPRGLRRKKRPTIQ